MNLAVPFFVQAINIKKTITIKMSLVRTTFYAKSDGSQRSGSGGGYTRTTNITNIQNTEFSTEAEKLANQRLIWSQPFDGT